MLCSCAAVEELDTASVTAEPPTTVLHFAAILAGDQYPTSTGSPATGAARIEFNTAAQTIDARIEIHGLRLDELAHHLSHAPVGPMHLHRYQGDEATLIFPFPMSSSYVETPDGFTVTFDHYPYAEGAQIVHSGLTVEEFATALREEPVFVNIHTARFPDGEISGRLTTEAAANR